MTDRDSKAGVYRTAIRERQLCPRTGFTLIELMVVVGIMGIVAAMSMPAIYRIWHKESLRKTVSEVTEVLSNARARAILQGGVCEVVFHARDGRFELVGGGGGGGGSGSTRIEEGISAGFSTSQASGSGKSGQIPEEIAVAQLKVNGVSCMDFDVARVRFYPNGTCDELRLILLRPDDGASRGIFLEVTTGLADVETDPNKLASEIR